jgi:hypothetical protein
MEFVRHFTSVALLRNLSIVACVGRDRAPAVNHVNDIL